MDSKLAYIFILVKKYNHDFVSDKAKKNNEFDGRIRTADKQPYFCGSLLSEVGHSSLCCKMDFDSQKPDGPEFEDNGKAGNGSQELSSGQHNPTFLEGLNEVILF
jgi:hypothetical protein